MKVGGPAIIAALTIIVGMVVLGFIVGVAMGWKQMDSIFLGGMLAMSSTSIIYKAFEDLGLRTQRFYGAGVRNFSHRGPGRYRLDGDAFYDGCQ